MNYEDAAVVQLADGLTRAGVFDELALENVLDAAFDTSDMAVEGPFEATFDQLRIGVVPAVALSVEGGWSRVGGNDRTDARFDVRWPILSGGPRIDATWEGTITARAVTSSGVIDAVAATWPEVRSLDDDIGPLPADPVALELARRAALEARLRDVAAQPDAVDGRVVDGLLARSGARTVAELVRRDGVDMATAALRVSFAEARDAAPTPRAFPIAAAVLVREGTAAVTQLLRESKTVQRLLQSALERPPRPGLIARAPVVVAWVLPAATFDDPGWPGAAAGATAEEARVARRAAAAAWLSAEGIALVPFDPPA